MIDIEYIQPPHINEVMYVKIDKKEVTLDEMQQFYKTLVAIYPNTPIIIGSKEISLEYINKDEAINLRDQLDEFIKKN